MLIWPYAPNALPVTFQQPVNKFVELISRIVISSLTQTLRNVKPVLQTSCQLLTEKPAQHKSPTANFLTTLLQTYAAPVKQTTN